jgi:hypothetical protein
MQFKNRFLTACLFPVFAVASCQAADANWIASWASSPLEGKIVIPGVPPDKKSTLQAIIFIRQMRATTPCQARSSLAYSRRHDDLADAVKGAWHHSFGKSKISQWARRRRYSAARQLT